jgi:hypothetical protein
MPNGRSGGFLIGRDRLQELLRPLSPEAVIGKTGTGTVTVERAAALVAQHDDPQIRVEEHDHAWYLIHLTDWISVDAASQLHARLRECHGEWRPEAVAAKPALPLGIKSQPNEEIVVDRESYPSRDGEIAAVTTLRFISLGEAWPGPSYFGYSTPIESCRRVEYQRRTHWLSFLIGWIMVAVGIAGLVWAYRRDTHWILFAVFALLVLAGLPRLFRLRSSEFLFHCEKETLKWRVSGADPDIEKVLEFATSKGIERSMPSSS